MLAGKLTAGGRGGGGGATSVIECIRQFVSALVFSSTTLRVGVATFWLKIWMWLNNSAPSIIPSPPV